MRTNTWGRTAKSFVLGYLLAVAGGAPLPAASQERPIEEGLVGPPLNVFFPRGGRFDIVGLHGNLSGEIVKNAPYSASATTERIQVLQDGNRITRTNRALVYRDSEGRTRREQTLDTIGPWFHTDGARTIVTISDPVAQKSYVLDPDELTAQRLPAVPPDFIRERLARDARPRPPGTGPEMPGELVTEDLGEQQIGGLTAVGTRSRFTIPSGAISNDFAIEVTSEQWHSPELQVIVFSRQTDPLVGETVYRLENIVRQEQPSRLFEIPPGYQLRENAAPGFPARPGRPPPEVGP
jgi:hypothetical protein